MLKVIFYTSRNYSLYHAFPMCDEARLHYLIALPPSA